MRALSILAAAAAGALATYFLDPEQGPKRRAVTRDRLASGLRQASESGQAFAEDLRSRTGGFVAGARRRLEREPVSDEVLAERVRARIGRNIAHPGSIDVSVAQGVVTLRGPILASEVSRILRAVRAVAGVREVLNELEVHESPGNVPGLQG